MRTPNNILIYRLGSIGDTVLALPAFRLIRQRHPEARITILTNVPVSGKAAPVDSVLQNTGLYDDIIKYSLGLREWGGLGSLWLQIVRRRFNVVYFLTQPRGYLKSLRDYLFFKACGIRRVIGVPFRRHEFASLPVAGTGLHTWEAERLVGCVGSFPSDSLQDDKWWNLNLTCEELKEANQLLTSAGITRPFIAIGPGTKVDSKDWSEDNWSRLLVQIAQSFPSLGLVVVGSQDERGRSQMLIAKWKGASVDVCGAISPRVSAAIIKASSLFIGHDSGPMHLAGAVGTPCVAIFSARSLPGQWHPKGINHTILYHKTFCYGCQLDVCESYGKRCMLGIEVDEVLNAVRRALSNVS